jgi:hypothetical protein
MYVLKSLIARISYEYLINVRVRILTLLFQNY